MASDFYRNRLAQFYGDPLEMPEDELNEYVRPIDEIRGVQAPEAPQGPGVFDQAAAALQTGLGYTLGAPKRAVDVAAGYYSGGQFRRDALAGEPASAGELVREALLPEQEARDSYLKSAARAGLGFATDVATDPLTYLLPAGGKLGQAAAAAFVPSMALSTVQGARQTAQTIGQEGFTPRALESGLEAAASGAFALGAARHALKGRAPRTIEEAVAQRQPETSAQVPQVPTFQRPSFVDDLAPMPEWPEAPMGYTRQGVPFIPPTYEVPPEFAPRPQRPTAQEPARTTISPDEVPPVETPVRASEAGSERPGPVPEPPSPSVRPEPRYAYRARNVGEEGIPGVGHSQASLSEADVRRIAPSRTEAPQEVVKVDLSKLREGEDYIIHERPGAEPWVQFKRPIPEEQVERAGDVTPLDREAASKAEPPLRQAVAGADTGSLAQRTGLSPEAIEKGRADVDADGTRELSPEAVAVKRAVLEQGVPETGTPAPKLGRPIRPIPPEKLAQGPPPSEAERLLGAELAFPSVVEPPSAGSTHIAGDVRSVGMSAPRPTLHPIGADTFPSSQRISNTPPSPGTKERIQGHHPASRQLPPDTSRVDDAMPGISRSSRRDTRPTKETVSTLDNVEVTHLDVNNGVVPVNAEPSLSLKQTGQPMHVGDANHSESVAKAGASMGPNNEAPSSPAESPTRVGAIAKEAGERGEPKYATEPTHEDRVALKDRLVKTFSSLRVQETKDGYVLPTPSGKRILITPKNEILFDPKLLEKHHGSMAVEAVRAGQMKVSGVTYRVGKDVAIDIADNGVLPHESLHVFLDHFASSSERELIRKKWQDEAELQGRHWEETASDAYNSWFDKPESKTPIGKFFTRLRDFFLKLKDALFPSAEGVFRKVKGGEPFTRTDKTFRPGSWDRVRPFAAIEKVEKEGAAGASQTQTEPFKRWFGKSKVVNEKGEPLVVYHGSGANGITEFDPKRAGDVLRSDWGEGIYFTPSKWLADGYRDGAAVATDAVKNRLWDEYEAAAKRLGTTPMNAAIDLGFGSEKYNSLREYENRWRARSKEVSAEGRGEVYPAYVSLKNPLIYKYEGMTDPFLARQAREKGHDGLIILNDGGFIDEVVAFRPEQIKSATKNVGTFDASNPDIRFATAPKQPPLPGAALPFKPKPKEVSQVDLLGKRAADNAKEADRIASKFEALNEKFRIGQEGAQRVEERGTIEKAERPAFREAGQPDAEQTKGFRFSSEDIQRSGRQMVDAVKSFRQAELEFRQKADPVSAEAMKFARQTMERAIKQWQVYRSAAGRAVKTFDRPIPADVIQSLREAGSLARVKEIKERVPITTNIINSLKNWKNLTDAEKEQFRRDLVDQYRLNLFSTTSFTLDLVGNATELAGQTAGGLARDLVRVSRGDVSFPSMQGMLRAIRHARDPLPPEVAQAFQRTVSGEPLRQKGGTFTYRSNLPSKVYDYMVGLPLYAKGGVDSGAKKFGAMATLYRDALEVAHKRGATGLARQELIDRLVNHPTEEMAARAIANGQKAGFDRPLSETEEKFAASTATRLLVSPFARWPFQFTRWAGEMLGYNREVLAKMVKGQASREEVAHYLAKTATGLGGLYLLNQTLYDRTDFNSMEYVDEDGNRVRLSNRDPIPTALWLLSVIKGDEAKAAKGLQYASLPGAALLSGEGGGLLMGLVQGVRRAMENTQSDPRALRREIEDTINRAIPGQAVLSALETVIDPKIREGIGANLPGVSLLKDTAINPVTGEDLEPKQSIGGLELPSIGGTPVPGATRILDPVQKLLSRYGLVVYRGPRSPIAGYPPGEVPEDMRREWTEAFGQARQKLLAPLARAMGVLEKKDPEQVRKAIQKRDLEAAHYADSVLRKKYGGPRKLHRQPTMREMARPTIYQGTD